MHLKRPLPFSAITPSRKTEASFTGLQQKNVSLEGGFLEHRASHLRTIIGITLPFILANVIAGGIMSFSTGMIEASDSWIIAMGGQFHPMTKTIYELDLRLGDGPYVARALGIIGAVIVAVCMLVANGLLGRRMGEPFRAQGP